MIIDGENGILISKVAADMLSARVGDSIMLYMTTDAGQYNTSTLYIKGIFSETSLFGYVAYMRQEDLNRLLLRDPESASDIAIYAEAGENHKKLLLRLMDILDDSYNVLPYLSTKDALNTEITRYDYSKGPVLALLTLDAHLDQITMIIKALQIITWCVLVLFMLIIMVGILNTYRVLLYERTGEIGTLRAIGMHQNQVLAMFLFEAVILAAAASFSGFIISLLLMNLLRLVNLSGIPGSGMLTEQGMLVPNVNFVFLVLTLLMMITVIVIAAYGPAKKASALRPADAMRNP